MHNIAKQGDREAVAQRSRGFALPVAMAIGMAMIALASTSMMVAQSSRNTAIQRRDAAASALVSDSALFRAMVQLSKPENGVLLIRNYDPINPKTGQNYLGADGLPKSGDETGTAVDQWTGYDPSTAPCFQQLGRSAPNVAFTGAIGTDETYTIRAYRYDKQKKLGTLLVEGNYRGQLSLVAITLSIQPDLADFPGVVSFHYVGFPISGKAALRGRQILGQNGNVYYASESSADPALTSSSAPGDATRPNYLTAVWSSALDGNTTDNVSGKLFACRLSASIPVTIQGPNLGLINTSTTLSGSAGGITHYQMNGINLINNDTLTIDTTAGPVYLYMAPIDGKIILQNTAKILNIRTDGQPPRVGDFRILNTKSTNAYTRLYGQSCIQNAFLYARVDDLQMLSTGPGCPGGKNANFEGVVWAEEILSSKNNASNQYVDTYDASEINTLVTPGATAGIAVSDDVSSLVDLLEYITWPVRYKYESIKSWQRVG